MVKDLLDQSILALVHPAKALLEQAKVELAQELAVVQTSGLTLVKPGDNLASMVAAASAGQKFLVSPEVTTPFLTVTKPVTLIGGKLHGATTVTAPNVEFCGVSMEGSTQGQTILTAADGTKVNGCRLIGSKIGQHRGILVNAKDISVRNTSITNIWHSIDTQAIGGFIGTKNLLIDGCFLEASGENVMFGGADTPTEADIPNGIVMRNCQLSKPKHWMNNSGAGCKNLFELKNAKNVLVENCLFERSFVDAQTGFAIVFTVRNQDGKNPWATVEDVMFKNNVIRGMAGGISFLGTDYIHPSKLQARITIEGNKFEDVNTVEWGWNGRQIQIIDGGDSYVIRNNTFSGNKVNSFMLFGGFHTNGVPRSPLTNFVVEGNDFLEGDYGMHGDGAPGLGKVALDMYAPGGYTWNNNIVRKGTSGRNIAYPAGTTVI